jgi:hypothetical protein
MFEKVKEIDPKYLKIGGAIAGALLLGVTVAVVTGKLGNESQVDLYLEEAVTDPTTSVE